jgi:hypothetical protein
MVRRPAVMWSMLARGNDRYARRHMQGVGEDQRDERHGHEPKPKRYDAPIAEPLHSKPV